MLSSWSLDSNELRRVCESVPTAEDDPVVEPHIEVGTGDLRTGTQDAAAGLRLGELVPGKNRRSERVQRLLADNAEPQGGKARSA